MMQQTNGEIRNTSFLRFPATLVLSFISSLADQSILPYIESFFFIMSLSFVSSAVQIGTADGGFEEKKIENKETEAVNRRNAHKPLFEQLRSNQEEDEEKKAEMQRQIMRSTCALDDEDVAHLDSLERQRSDRERKIQEQTKNELDSFRAAKALRQQAVLSVDLEEDDNNGSNKNSTLGKSLGSKEKAAPAPSLPMIKVKKRKRRTQDSTETTSKPKIAEQQKSLDQESKTKIDGAPAATPTEEGVTPTQPSSVGGLGGLLSGYGSSSSDEE